MEIEPGPEGLRKKVIVEIDNFNDNILILQNLPRASERFSMHKFPFFLRMTKKLMWRTDQPLEEQYPIYVTITERQLRDIGKRMLFEPMPPRLTAPERPELHNARLSALGKISDYFAAKP
jgi:hypothetical protein